MYQLLILIQQMSEAKKNDVGKVQYSDIPQLTLKSVATTFNYGASKYGKFNYTIGMKWLRYYDACQRHLQAWMTGEDIDESGNNHIDHAICSLMMLRENIHMDKGIDDRNTEYRKDMSDGDFQMPNIKYQLKKDTTEIPEKFLDFLDELVEKYVAKDKQKDRKNNGEPLEMD